MTVRGNYQVFPLCFTKSSRCLILLIFWLSVGLPSSFSASYENLDTSDPKTSDSEATLTVVCPDDFMAKCNSAEAATPTSVAEFEAAGGSVSSTCAQGFILFEIVEKASGGCPEVITRTVTVSNSCGEVASCSYIMTLEEDVEPPIVICPSDLTVNCRSDVPSADAGSVSATDECGTVTVTHIGDDTSMVGLCPGIILRNYMAEDNCGNIATCIQTITVNNICGPNAPCSGSDTSICDIDVPVFTVDLSGSPDNSWTSPEVISSGFCCEQSGSPSEMCVHFILTLANDVAAIQVDVLSGVDSSDGLMFQLGCGDFYPIGDMVCLTGGQTYDLIFCRPSNKPYTFNITSYSAASLPDVNQDGIPDVCLFVCENLNMYMEDCHVVYPGYAPAECVEITATPLSGLPPYSYLWSSHDTAEVLTVCPTTDQVYTVTVTDANGCSSVALTTVHVINVRCNGGNGVQMCVVSNAASFPVTQCVDERQVEDFLARGDMLGSCGADPCRDTGGPILSGDTIVKDISLDPDHHGPRPFVRPGDQNGDFIFPNPVTDKMTIQYEMPFNQTVAFIIYDAQGKHIDGVTTKASAGTNTYRFNTSEIGPGLYIVRYGYGIEARSLKFVKF